MNRTFLRLRGLWLRLVSKVRRQRLSAAQLMAKRWRCDALLAMRNLDQRMERWQTVRKEVEAEGEVLLKRYEAVQERIREVADQTLAEMADARAVIRQYDKAEEALSSELEIAKEVTIKDLALQRQVTREQLKADMAILARHSPPVDDEE